MLSIAKVRIATFHFPPWNILEYDSANASLVKRYGGLTGEILTNALAASGVDYELVVQSNEEQTNDMSDSASHWAGTLGALHRGEADVSGQCSTMTTMRQRAFAFCQPLFESRAAVIIAEKQSEDGQSLSSQVVAGPLQAYSGRLWLAIGVLALLVTVVGALLDVSNWRWRPMAAVVTNNGSRQSTIRTILLKLEELLRILSRQGRTSQRSSASSSLRLLILSWALMCIVLSALYPAALFAVLTVRPQWTPPFSNMAEMLDAGYRFAVSSDKPEHLQHFRRMLSPNIAHALDSPQVLRNADSLRNQSLLAFFGWATYVDDWQSSACDLRVLEPFDVAEHVRGDRRLFCSVVIAKNATRLHRLLTRRIEELRAAGIVQAIIDRMGQWRHDFDDKRPLHLRELCKAKRQAAEGRVTRVRTLAFAATRPMFRVLAVGVCAAAFVLGVEWLFHRYVL